MAGRRPDRALVGKGRANSWTGPTEAGSSSAVLTPRMGLRKRESMERSSRERMLAALTCQPLDDPPCCFMQFTALEARSRNQFEMVDRLLAWGLDATVQVPPWLLTVPGDSADLRGLEVRFHSDVILREWVELEQGERYPVLNKEYDTPAGTLKARVSKTDDWPYGDHVPFLDDFIVPRARKPLITSPDDLGALRYLLMPPAEDTVCAFREAAHCAKAFAQERGLLVSGGLGIGADMAGWLCGLQELVFLAVDEPAFVAELMQLIAAWNLERMETVLDVDVDLWVRRGWYEGCDFWPPRLFRRFILPNIKAEAELAHSRGAKFGYILTSGVMPLLDMLLEARVDVLIGVDPLQGGLDLADLKARTAGRICLWGGVNGPITVEQGSAAEVRSAVTQALDLLAPGGGFILSPVDDVEDPSAHALENARIVAKTWKEWVVSGALRP
jgi:hypothetical protein